MVQRLLVGAAVLQQHAEADMHLRLSASVLETGILVQGSVERFEGFPRVAHRRMDVPQLHEGFRLSPAIPEIVVEG